MINLIPQESKIKVYWDDKPENYSKDGKVKVRNYFANKYGVNKNNINVVYRPVKVNSKGEVIEITGAGLENIMDANYQRSLMKQVIERDDITVDFNRILALDDKVNSEIDFDTTTPQHRNWSVKWVMVDNFLSFGEANFLSFNKLKGLTIVNSIPENQGGKTTITIDAIKFLLHGTTSKTDTNEQIFNTFSNKNELIVRGMIDVEGEEILIERKMKRSAKKGGGWTISNKTHYYTILPNGDEEVMNEENTKLTTKKIKETIGSEKDFELLVLSTEKNLEDLISFSPTDSGKILTRLIGLEILEVKEATARAMYNEFAKKKKSNEFDVITLSQEIIDHEEKVVQGTELETFLGDKMTNIKAEITQFTAEKENYLKSKQVIEVVISEMNPEKLESEIGILTGKGIGLSDTVKATKVKLAEIGEIVFNEDEFLRKTKLLNKTNTDKALNEAEITRIKRAINQLISGGICQSCNRKLDDVDNTEHIKKHQLEMDEISAKILENINLINELTEEIEDLSKTKKQIDEKNRLELDVDRAEVEMGSLRNNITAKKNDLAKYKLNLDSIELNKKLDIEIENVKTKLNVYEYSKDETITKIEKNRTDIQINRDAIINKLKLIETIKKEEAIEKIFKVYIELVGKKGISKLVLRSVLPIINSEVQRLLDDVVDFDVEIFIDDKNNVQFILNKDGISKMLKSGSGLEKTASSIALRCVLGKLSTLPMPNFITFDEVLGKVAPSNLEKLKLLFDKVADMYEIVFVITHNDLVKDWATNILTITKENNISKVNVS
jgi:DNA repair exonuclease SbcCD ATPase subunit